MIRENIEEVLGRIAAACRRSGRDPREITLVAVAKTFPSSMIREALQAGISDIGENYVQELIVKQRELAGEAIRWHFIGHLQRNKAKAIIGNVALVHAVDSVELAREISRRAVAGGVSAEILVEVHTSGEETKFGLSAADTINAVTAMAALPSLTVRGLMTIGPFLPDPEASRPAFRMLRTLREQLVARGHALPHLSMGMTGDLEVAIEEGATIVRVGSAIFGKRTRPQLS